jgi:hypothetical protein
MSRSSRRPRAAGREAYAAERRALENLRHAGTVTDDLNRHLQWDLDLAESQLG